MERTRVLGKPRFPYHRSSESGQMNEPEHRKTPFRSNRGGKPFQPAIGTDFGRVEDLDAKTRGFIARVVALTSAGGVIATGGYALMTGDNKAVITVWAIAGPFVGAVVSYYFGPRRGDLG